MINKEIYKQVFATKSILVVDDDDSITDSLSVIFGIFFCRVYVANDVKSAKEISSANHIDIVLTDVSIKNMDGISLAREIKQSNSDISFVFMSGYDRCDYISLIQEYGGLFIEKPIDKDVLFEYLHMSILK